MTDPDLGPSRVLLGTSVSVVDRSPNSMSDFSSHCHDSAFGGGPVIDSATIETLRELGGDDDPGLVLELIDLFLQDASDRMQTIRAAWEAGDLQAVARAAHALKSASANIGALGFSTTCKEVELGAKAGDPDQIADTVAACTEMFREVQTALHQMRDDA